jgi:Spy/CpxP family protein refolding chaperone
MNLKSTFFHKAIPVLLLGGTLLLSTGTPAIPGPPDPYPGMDNPDRMERIHQRIEMIRMWKLTEALDLDETTAAKLFPVINQYDRERMYLERERFLLMRDARESSRQTEDKARAGEILDRMENNQAALIENKSQRHEAVKKILPPAQMTRFILFEQQFDQEMQQRIHEIRKNRERLRGPTGFWNEPWNR